MNKVAERCKKDSNAKFHFASKRLYFEAKTVKVCLYLAAVVPIILTFLPIFNSEDSSGLGGVVLSLISFCITLATELSSSFMAMHKESAILEHQMFEAEITGSTFSKIEYDREATNEIHELAIRKGLPKMKKSKKQPTRNVPEEISDDYSYFYLCRIKAATEKYLLSRIFYIYFFVLVAVILVFIFGSVFVKGSDPATYLSLIVGFYPLVMPIIKDCLACKKAMKKCSKICADIDNFFADGDDSIGRLARFYYYIQNLEFEMLVDRPAVFNIFPFMFRRGINVLQEGVTYRFLGSIKELKSRSLMLKGALKVKNKDIITKVEYDDEYLERLAKEKRVVVVNKKPSTKSTTPKVEEVEEVKPVVRKTTVKKAETAETPVKKTTTTRKTTPKTTETVEVPVKKTTTAKKTSDTTKTSTSTTKKTTK